MMKNAHVYTAHKGHILPELMLTCSINQPWVSVKGLVRFIFAYQWRESNFTAFINFIDTVTDPILDMSIHAVVRALEERKITLYSTLKLLIINSRAEFNNKVDEDL